MKLTKTPLGDFQLGREPRDIRSSHESLSISWHASRQFAFTSVNPPMKSKADEEEQSPLSKIVRLPYETEYTCSLPSICAVILGLAEENSREGPGSPALVSPRVGRVHSWKR